MSEPIRLNLGAGPFRIKGFIPVDRTDGNEAYPLTDYADDTVEVIRVSHLLEHFGWQEVPSVLADWYRALQPGGRIMLSVPDLDKVYAAGDDPKRLIYLMGSQTDKNDFHKSTFDRATLELYMSKAGFKDIVEWVSEIPDCASLPISLNLQGVKPGTSAPSVEHALPPSAEPSSAVTGEHVPVQSKKSVLAEAECNIKMEAGEYKLSAVMSTPRLGFNATWGCIHEALSPWRIPVRRHEGAFWDQCMERLFESCVQDGLDWLLAIDYDSLFTRKHIQRMLNVINTHPEIDALAPLQIHRSKDVPLMTKSGATSQMLDGSPLQVDSAAFGLTLISVKALGRMAAKKKKARKPWFCHKPDPDGGYGDNRMDADVHFWHQWRDAGNTLYVDPQANIGHMVLVCRELVADEKLGKYVPAYIQVQEWLKRERDGTEKGEQSCQEKQS